jgi:GT2 family glycosyltransferase
LSDGTGTAAPELSVLFVTYNSWPVIVAALESLAAHPPRRRDGSPMPYEIVVVDNASPERDAKAEQRVQELLGRMRGTLVMHDSNGGYSKGMNLAYARCSGPMVLVCNPDIIFEPGCVDALLRYLEDHPDCGAAAPKGWWDRGKTGRLPPNILPTLADLLRLTWAAVSHRGVRSYSRRRTKEALRVWQAKESIDLAMLSGCCFLMRRELIQSIGFFDERFPLYYEDTDLSVRIKKAGKRIVQVAGADLVHLFNRSAETDQNLAMARYWISRRLYYRKWYGALGAWIYDRCRAFLETEWAKTRGKTAAHPVTADLGASMDKPVIELPRRVERCLVELAMDPYFYLAAGMFGGGERWSPSDTVFANFGPTTYYFRVLDLDGREPEHLGVWRYTRVYPRAWLKPADLAREAQRDAAHERG